MNNSRITIGSNRSLRSLGRANARPLTIRYAQAETCSEFSKMLCSSLRHTA